MAALDFQTPLYILFCNIVSVFCYVLFFYVTSISNRYHRVALVGLACLIAVTTALSIYVPFDLLFVLWWTTYLSGVLTHRYFVSRSWIVSCMFMLRMCFGRYLAGLSTFLLMFFTGYVAGYRLYGHWLQILEFLPLFTVSAWLVLYVARQIDHLIYLRQFRVLVPYKFYVIVWFQIANLFVFTWAYWSITHQTLCHILDFQIRLSLLGVVCYLCYRFMTGWVVFMPQLCYERSRRKCVLHPDRIIFVCFLTCLSACISFLVALMSIDSYCDALPESQGKYKRFERRRRLPVKEEDVAFIDNVQFLSQLLRDIRNGTVDREQHRTIIRRNFTRDEIRAASRDAEDNAHLSGYLRLATTEGRSVGRQAFIDGAGRYDSLLLTGELARARTIYNSGASPSTVNLGASRYKRLLRILEHHLSGIPESQGFSSLVTSITDNVNDFVNGLRAIKLFGTAVRVLSGGTSITTLTIITAVLAIAADIVALRHLYKTGGPWKTYLGLRIAALCTVSALNHLAVTAQVVRVFDESMRSAPNVSKGPDVVERVQYVYDEFNTQIVEDVAKFFKTHTTVPPTDFTSDGHDCIELCRQLQAGHSLQSVVCHPRISTTPRFMGTQIPQHYFHSETLIRRVLNSGSRPLTPIKLVTQFAINQMIPWHVVADFVVLHDEHSDYAVVTNGKSCFPVASISDEQYSHPVYTKRDNVPDISGYPQNHLGYAPVALTGEWDRLAVSQNDFLPIEMVQLLAHALFGVGEVAVNTDRAVRISKIAGAFNTSVTLGKNIRDLFQIAFELAYEKIFGHPYYGDLSDEQRTLTYTLASNMQVLVDSSHNMSLEVAEKILALSPQVEEHLRNLAIASPNRLAFAPFAMIVSQFRPLVSKAQGFRNSLGDRRKTVGIALTGPPGCGKTEVVPLIHQIVMKLIGEKDHLNRLLPRPEGAYMNGYLPPQHLGMLYDDFFQLKDDEINVQHVSEFIYLLTNKPYLPNYADVNSKGLNPFTALVIYMTTNDKNLAVTKTGFPGQDKNAFLRRWFVWEVRNTHPNYNPQTGRFNPPVEFSAKYMSFDLVQLHWVNGHVNRTVLSANHNVYDVARFTAGQIKAEKAKFESKRASVSTDTLILNLEKESISGLEPIAVDDDVEFSQKLTLAKSQGIGSWFSWLRGYDWDGRWQIDAQNDLFPYGRLLRYLSKSSPVSYMRSGAIAPFARSDVDLSVLKPLVHAHFEVPSDTPQTVEAYLTIANIRYHEAHTPMAIFEATDKVAAGIRSNFKYIGVALVFAVGTAIGAYFALRKSKPQVTVPSPPAESHAGGNYEKGVPKIPQRRLPPKAALKPEPVAVSQVADANARDLVNKLPSQFAYFTMHLCDQEGMVEASVSGWGVCVFGNQFIMPSHYLGDYPPDRVVIDLVWRGANYVLEPNMFEVKRWPERDIMTVRCRNVQFGSDIRHLFIKENQMDSRLLGSLFRVLPSNPTSPTMTVETASNASVFLADVKSSINKVTKTITSCKRYLSLALANANGYCGALLMLDNKHAGEKMCGFHFAGSDNVSFFAIINQSDFAQNLFGTDLVVSQCAPYDYVTGSELELSSEPHPDDKFLPQYAYRMGTVARFYCNHIARDTKICRTRLDPDFTPRMSPAAMHPKLLNGIRTDPLLLAQAKSAVPLMNFVAEVRLFLNVAVSMICRRYSRTKVWPKGILSFEESLNAPIDYNRLNPIRTDTSPGFGFSSHSTDAGKKSFCRVSDDGAVEPVGDALKTSYDETMSRLARGISIPVIYRVAQKDELRLNARVESLSTRTVKGGPVNIVLAEKSLFGCVVEWACQNFMIARQTFMINTMGGPMWSYMYRLAINRRVIVADIKNNDNEFQRELRTAECTLRNYVADKCTQGRYTPEEIERVRTQRATLDESLKSPFELIGFLLYVRSLSMSSGSWLTSLSNGLGNDAALEAMFLKIVAREDPALFARILNGSADVDDYFVHFHNGDDLIMFVSNDCPYITYDSLEKEAALFGRTFQKPDKGLSGVDFDGTIATADYLSRGFVERDGCVYAPLRAEKIESIPFWRWNNVIPDEVMQPELCEAALREWFQHGLAVFTEKKTYYDEHLVRLGYRTTRLSYAKCHSDWSGQH